jgi:hypothetical protein
MKFCEYIFIHVRNFVRSDTPLEITFDGKPNVITVDLNLLNENFRNIGESVYLITVNELVKYVGEYSKTLGERWIKRKKDKYIWHDQDINISNELKAGSKVSLYLIESPFCMLPNGIELNVAKAIEHDILQRAPTSPELWNKRNKQLDLRQSIRLEEFA